MNHYNAADFMAYYGGAWMRSPTTGRAVKVVDIRNRDDDVTELTFSDSSRCPLADLDWKHVQPPPLGFRHIDDGKMLYYITRRAMRQQSKGITPTALTIRAPKIAVEVSRAVGETRYAISTQLSDKLAQEIFNPTFMSLGDAIKKLTSDDHSVALALSNYWGISLGLSKENQLILYYKETPVGSSSTGKSWKFVDNESEEIFKRSF